jgi:hypothetical protein
MGTSSFYFILKGAIGLLLLQLLGLLLVSLLAGCGSPDRSAQVEQVTGLPDQVDFNLHVKPILSDRCFACHGPDANSREADLRLDTEEGAFAALGEKQNYHPIVPGKPWRSELFRRIISIDPETVMPPATSNLELSDYEIAVLKKWIEQGAPWKKHWSLIPPEKQEVPAVKNQSWPRNDIDRFVLARLEREGLQPAAEASKEQLLRRVTLDLTGLPPTVEELEAFLADNSPKAYEKVVERLLASPHYGERMAMEWLDVARYADTHGYQDDGPSNHWPWRDWIIKAFNQNLPFDKFLIWQLAGDLLPNPTREQLLATGFNRSHMQNGEGGIVAEEYRVEYVADRTNTTAKALLGLTLECARCHDHKYDALSQKEYFQFSAFFNNNNEDGQIPNEGAAGPTILFPDSASEAVLQFLEAKIESEKRKFAETENRLKQDFLTWEKQVQARPTGQKALSPEGLEVHLPMEQIQKEGVVNLADKKNFAKPIGEPRLVPGVQGQGIAVSKGSYLDIPDKATYERHEPFTVSVWVNPSREEAEVPLLTKNGQVYIAYRGYDLVLQNNHVMARVMHGWPFNAIAVKSQEKIPVSAWTHLALTYDGSGRAAGLRLFVNGEPVPVEVEQDFLFKTITTYSLPRYQGQLLRVGHRNSFEAIRFEEVRVDELRIYRRALPELEVAELAGKEELAQVLRLPPQQRTSRQQEALYAFFLHRHSLQARRHFSAVQELTRQRNSVQDTLPEVMVMRERFAHRPAFVLERGLYDARGEEVAAATPGSVLPFPRDLPPNRLGLAQWLLDPRNPLPARVTMNRYWQLYFGRGLVSTPDDFGNQGRLPSHPELLDWLALRFRASGWDVKAMQRLIVLSATYRQSSVCPPELRERDPDNELLARGPRVRLTAEMVRDQALATSGLLVRKIGGPSVKPYQPPGLWEEVTSGRQLTTYVQDHGEKLYRRTMYTFIKRTVPPPSLVTFDVADRNYCTVRRQATTTPLQALITLNDPQHVEAARVLAERIVQKGEGSPQEQIARAFRSVTCRQPKEQELTLLQDLYGAELKNFRQEQEQAEALLRVGEFPRDEKLGAPEVAALTVVVSTILNLDEAINR